MAESNVNKTDELKKPAVSEAIEGFIEKKKAERAQESASIVQESAEETQGEVADVMAGVDKPKEAVSERTGESGEKGDIKATVGTKGDDDDVSAISAKFQGYTLPRETIMVKKVRVAIKKQIKKEMKRAKKLEKNLATGTAQEYSESISKIRTLKERLASLITATATFVKNLYVQYFAQDGKRKPLDEL